MKKNINENIIIQKQLYKGICQQWIIYYFMRFLYSTAPPPTALHPVQRQCRRRMTTSRWTEGQRAGLLLDSAEVLFTSASNNVRYSRGWLHSRDLHISHINGCRSSPPSLANRQGGPTPPPSGDRREDSSDRYVQIAWPNCFLQSFQKILHLYRVLFMHGTGLLGI